MSTTPTIPVGEFNAEKIADAMYDNEAVRSPLFEEAYELFPDCGHDQLDEATDYIFDHMCNHYDELLESLTEQQREDVEMHLYESIQAGLS